MFDLINTIAQAVWNHSMAHYVGYALGYLMLTGVGVGLMMAHLPVALAVQWEKMNGFGFIFNVLVLVACTTVPVLNVIAFWVQVVIVFALGLAPYFRFGREMIAYDKYLGKGYTL